MNDHYVDKTIDLSVKTIQWAVALAFALLTGSGGGVAGAYYARSDVDHRLAILETQVAVMMVHQTISKEERSRCQSRLDELEKEFHQDHRQ